MAALVAGSPIPEVPDLGRMRGERHARLQAGMEAQGLDALVLLGTGGVAYATGAVSPGVDSGRGVLFRPVAVVVRGASAPHLFTPYPDGAPADLPPEHLHDAVYPELDDGAAALLAAVGELVPAGGRLAFDELTHALGRALSGREAADAGAVLGAARLCKTADELACIRAAQRINELAMSEVQPGLRPGVRQTDLSATFLRRIFELGATANCIDPIWQVMPPRRQDGPWTTHGDVAFPTASTDRLLREGDVIWVDTGISYEGYASDFGRTWIVGADPRPDTRQQAQFRRWQEVMAAVLERCKPGATALELGRAATAANDGVKPWIEHFYLAHGVGVDSAEMPLVGTDLGDAFDERMVLQPGMVLVLEPVIWDEGAAGYRSEDIVAVTDDGWEPLSAHPYDPFEGAW
ncbi:MAG TPA: Xaa-Pro peptidase family protein [Acidimicrobiales bacterium]|nr:Xaa-Pro peptidase family protein [Acidimicrobiales bacterium]